MKAKAVLAAVFSSSLVVLLLLGMSGCGSVGSPASAVTTSSSETAHTYAATSSVGDFIQWTIDPTVSPVAFNLTWNVTNTSNVVVNTFTLSGTCGSPDPTYDYRQCAVANASSTSPVTVGAVFDVLEVPGVAVFAHPETAAGRGNGTGNDEIHVGFLLDTNACNNSMSAYGGDYVMGRVAPVSNPNEAERVGIYRITPAFLSSVNSGSPGNLLHAGFSLAQVTGGLFQTVYGEGDDQGNNSGTFNGLSSFTLSCSGGVLNWENAEMTMPGVITSAGLFLMDGPETFGGVVAAKTTVMATIDDLANTSADILWQDKEVGACSSHSGCTDILNVTFGAEDNTGAVPATFSSLNGSTIPTINFRAASNTTAANATTQFASVNSGYTNNSLALTYPEPQNIPGLFYSDQTTSGQATPTLLIVAKINGKLLIFGSNGTTGTGGVTMCGPSLTYQSSAPTGDPSLAGLVCEPASGNFIGFEP